MTTSPTATHLEASSPSFNPDAVPPPENSTISIADSTIPRSTLPRGESGDILSETASLSLDAAVSSNSLPTPPTISSRASALAINNSQLTGKQEHYLKRELISEQVKTEIHELNSPTALRRFGAPFKSHLGEISPLDSELPILRYIFVHHVRDFPFLDKAREKEFWQDKLQVKLVELMVVSGVRTSSGFEERIRFSELEIVDSNAIETGVMHTIPEGNYINGWDVNVAGVRIKSERRNIRQHKHAEFILRVKRKGELEYFITRRYGRESQRISMRAFLRSLLHSAPVAQTKAMQEFLTRDPVSLTDDDVEDITCRKIMDEKRVEEQHQFYEIARKRAADLDEYMEQFRQDIIERNGLTKLFQEIKEKNTIEDLSIQYRKFAEWLRIEVAATIYHVFLAEDNSPEIFAQAKRIHSLIPYTVLKNVIRIANPAAVMSGVLDIFLAQPFGTRSLMQRIFSLTLHDGIKSFQKSIDTLAQKIDDDVLVNKIKAYTEASDEAKDRIRHDGESEDLIVAILRSDELPGQLSGPQMVRLFNAYKAFNSAVENDCDDSQKSNAQLFSYMKQLLKLCTRQRDKSMMLRLIEEPVTLQLFRDLFTIFYEPLVRVYKAANVYNSVTDFAHFIDDMIQVVEKCQEQDVSADPNQTVQAFIDLCQRHESNFYKFVHEVHVHDNGLFTQLMGWIEGILDFLRKGPTNGTLNVNELFEGSTIDKEKAIREINELISWQEARKKWHQDKTRQKMAAESTPDAGFNALSTTFSASDFGLDMGDIAEVNYEEESESEVEMEEEDELDPIEAERKRRAKRQDRLRRTAGEPVKPVVSEVHKLKGGFLTMLRGVLAQ
ncbi:PX domain-containing protein.12 [Ceratocystis platani]|uniref:PX domain-containing protein.12 n=1 Tax=Ceratocystis fimbriata f. sp. platani TaxID=88771 RepID=A0A0F8DCJ8_CERFI|nr:PX domain-containing protein.12 [Ceratocystis platani]